jgi:hypothetical protein
MRRSPAAIVLFALAMLAGVHRGNADPLPTKIGACA